ncbi:hypothetical protein [Streptosporangium minutum]|nr:hypothetical protein [Streptosporangium minutum]
MSDEWTLGWAILLMVAVFMSGAIHVLETRSALRYSFVRAGTLVGSIAACWLILRLLQVPM